jgi:hypothetical protein
MSTSAGMFELSMSFTQRRQDAKAQRTLHSIHGLLRRHAFVGQFDARGNKCDFKFTPMQASLVDRRLILSGRLVVKPTRGVEHSIDRVEARLLAMQGGIGSSPVRRQLLAGTAQTDQTATPDQKLEQEKGPETELQPGLHAFESPQPDEFGRPMVEATDASSFAGVLYFQLSPLDGSALGVPLDLSRVQLNGRLAPIDDTARDLQLLYTDLVSAIDGNDRDSANDILEKINRIFKEN